MRGGDGSRSEPISGIGGPEKTFFDGTSAVGEIAWTQNANQAVGPAFIPSQAALPGPVPLNSIEFPPGMIKEIARVLDIVSSRRRIREVRGDTINERPLPVEFFELHITPGFGIFQSRP